MSIFDVTPEQSGRRLTGRFVFLIASACFGVMFAVNGLMAYYAVSTFRGLSDPSPYEDGLAYQKDIDAARAQDARGWNVTAHVGQEAATGRRSIEIRFVDREGAPIRGLDVQAALQSPADVKLDAAVALREAEPGVAPGVYVGLADARPGQWDLMIDARRDNERLFRSVNRLDLR
ncbi:FixH family protein [Methylocella sp.]|uniref:FixH family protein n=1 Tax=Methylocella sp. TaxID=1978226 RepID=UPI0035AE327A